MKKINTFLAAAILLGATACDKKHDTTFTQEGRVALRINTSDITTRATDNAWEANDAIGIVLLKSGQTVIAEEKTVYKYVSLTGNSSFIAANNDNVAYYPADESSVDVLGFYPFAEINTDLTVPVVTTDQSKLSLIDLMVADKSSGHNITNAGVTFQFRHKLVKLQLTIKADESLDGVDISGGKLVVKGLSTKAKWDLATSELIEASDVAEISIPVTYNAESKTLNATGIVLPSKLTEGDVTITVEVDGRKYDAILGEELVSGTINILTVTISRKDPVTIEATIVDWATGITAELDAIEVDIDDESAGGVTGFSPVAEDMLKLTYIMGGELSTDTKQAVTYTYKSTKWATTTPLYWDNIVKEGTHAFVALYEPKAGEATGGAVKDYLVGKSAAVEFGKAVTFNDANSMVHAMSQITLTIKAGEGWKDNATLIEALTTRQINLNALKSIAVDKDGNAVIALVDGDAANILGTSQVESETIYQVAPQTLTDKHSVVLKLTNGNTYQVKLADVKKAGSQDKLFADGKLLAGSSYALTVTVNNKEIGLSGTIVPWTVINGEATTDPEL